MKNTVWNSKIWATHRYIKSKLDLEFGFSALRFTIERKIKKDIETVSQGKSGEELQQALAEIKPKQDSVRVHIDKFEAVSKQVIHNPKYLDLLNITTLAPLEYRKLVLQLTEQILQTYPDFKLSKYHKVIEAYLYNHDLIKPPAWVLKIAEKFGQWIDRSIVTAMILAVSPLTHLKNTALILFRRNGSIREYRELILPESVMSPMTWDLPQMLNIFNLLYRRTKLSIKEFHQYYQPFQKAVYDKGCRFMLLIAIEKFISKNPHLTVMDLTETLPTLINIQDQSHSTEMVESILRNTITRKFSSATQLNKILKELNNKIKEIVQLKQDSSISLRNLRDKIRDDPNYVLQFG